MAGIKRFITYIYAYENGTKGINAGFAKVEIRGNECRIEVHLRGTPIRMGMDQVYLFKVEGGQMLAFPMGEMRMIKGSGDYGTIIKADQIGGSEYSFVGFCRRGRRDCHDTLDGRKAICSKNRKYQVVGTAKI